MADPVATRDVRMHDHATPAGVDVRIVQVQKSLMTHNDGVAAQNRERFGTRLVLNVVSSPGSGKTALLERTVRELAGDLSVGIVVGDLETDNDAVRLHDAGAPSVQIVTGTVCHLEAEMVSRAVDGLAIDDLDVVVIENVGNLVCPASFDLGQHLNVALLSTPEGDDKPAKYPVMFRAADLILLSKCDLLSVLDDFDPAVARDCIRQLATDADVLELSAKSGAGMSAWSEWLTAKGAGVVATAPAFVAAQT